MTWFFFSKLSDSFQWYDVEAVIPGPPTDFVVNTELKNLNEAGHAVLPPGALFSSAVWAGFYSYYSVLVVVDSHSHQFWMRQMFHIKFLCAIRRKIFYPRRQAIFRKWLLFLAFPLFFGRNRPRFEVDALLAEATGKLPKYTNIFNSTAPLMSRPPGKVSFTFWDPKKPNLPMNP